MLITYFLVFVVMAFVLFIFVYGRYSRLDTELGRRISLLEDKEYKTKRIIEGLDHDILLKKDELKTLGNRIDALRSELEL